MPCGSSEYEGAAVVDDIIAVAHAAVAGDSNFWSEPTDGKLETLDTIDELIREQVELGAPHNVVYAFALTVAALRAYIVRFDPVLV